MFVRRSHALLMFVFMVAPALGQTAGMLGFQGLIKDDKGVPLDGSVDLEFRVFDALVAGNQVDITGDGNVDAADTKQVVGVPVAAGLFSTKFGPISPSAFDGSDRFLEVSVDGQPLSRIEMVTAVAVSERVNKPGTGTAAVSLDASSDDVVLETPMTELRLDAASSNMTFGIPVARGGVTPVLTFNLNTGTISAADSLSFETGGGARGAGIRMTIDDTGVTAGSLKVSAALAAGARGTGVAELTVNVDGDLELKVDGEIVDRWTALGDTGVVGDSSNRISGSPANFVTVGRFGAVISGGGAESYPNSVVGFFGTVGGGLANASGTWCTVSGGRDNTAGAFDDFYNTVGGGDGNTASGGYATVSGGLDNTASGFASFAAGNHANAAQEGMFVWADNGGDAFPAAGESNFAPTANQFLAKTTGGAVFVSAVNGSGESTAGVQLASGGGSWSSLSDRHSKENLAAVNGREALEKVAAMPISTWNYKSQNPSIRHIGPMAQDVFGAFGVGEKETMITTIDADGIALAAIQGLHELVQEKECDIADLESRNDELEMRLARLERILLQTTALEDASR